MLEENLRKKLPKILKVTCIAKEVPEHIPEMVTTGGDTSWPCPVVNVGDKYVFNPIELILEETDVKGEICADVLCSMLGGRPRSTSISHHRPGWGWGKEINDHDETTEYGRGHPYPYIQCETLERPVLFRTTAESIDLKDLQEKYPAFRPSSERPNWDKYPTTDTIQLGCAEKEAAARARMSFDPSEEEP